jgi:hypothetical protein
MASHEVYQFVLSPMVSELGNKEFSQAMGSHPPILAIPITHTCLFSSLFDRFVEHLCRDTANFIVPIPFTSPYEEWAVLSNCFSFLFPTF